MQQLTIDPPIPFLVPAVEAATIALIGCGGTGSHLAQTVSRLAAHCRDTGGPDLQLVFVDGDTVEHTNVGRQLFSASDVGKNKAQVLASRFGAVFGLNIVAFPQMLDQQRIANPHAFGILVGAVDSAAGRRAIVRQLGSYGWRIWLDCGNHESSGQVVCGSAGKAAIANGLCTQLPVASALYPELLKDAAPAPREDCATAMQDNAQSLMVNQTMAAIAGQYLYDLIVRRKLTRFRTVVDVERLSMRSDAITAAQLAQACGVTVDHILGVKATKKARKAA